ncbi:uncharacterized protein E0L32_011437 [Thyridium curvatum]|uniref:CID domain-containing protein n=1 Tax=Thyridium curvatum TaxID=1093900 RepID=A0A507B6V3_9PEZI|nr:uncharacterized protein E0L32_011437 [Thyridium curvatum]TPX18885.1 hypothetical protein E0L32_011437 [Thyridium curvatum]
MSASKKLAEFPDVEAKLQKPTKKSAFERQRAEAEEKRRREAAETAAVYEDFVKSFDRDDDGPNYNSPRGGGRPPHPSRFERPVGPPTLGGAGGKRHFGIPSTPSGLKSGPGSLGPAPTSFAKKRNFDGFKDRSESRGRPGNDDHEPLSVSKAFNTSDDEGEATVAERAEEKALARPTLRMANLPPGTSPSFVKTLVAASLTVEDVKMLPPSGSVSQARKSLTAIITLSAETAATDIDATVSALQHRYLGYGYYLSLHRHLSSAAITGGLADINSHSSTSQPFGAKRVDPGAKVHSSVPHGHGRAFAPPTSFDPMMGAGFNRADIFHVPVQPPRDVKQLRMIHKTIEGVLEHGPEFEALLMSRPDVQKDEKWAWIWDARSKGGVWYRYRLWEIITGWKRTRGQKRFVPLFEGSHAWKVPEQPLSFEFTTVVDEFVSDSEYNSSDEEDYEDEIKKQQEPGSTDQEEKLLNPIEKSKLTHLLAKLPTSLSKLRKGDIARVTAFALTHTSRGSDEVAELIVSNLERPFSHTLANPDYKPNDKDKPADGSRTSTPPAAEEKAANERDTSASMLVALYVISDILASSSTSGIRHAWRYRQLFEAVLKDRKVFEGLGVMPEKMGWGRLRAEKWKRSIGLVLSLWEGWSVFPVESQHSFVSSFENPPSLKKEEEVEKPEEEAKQGGKWKTVEALPTSKAGESGFRPAQTDKAAGRTADGEESIATPDATDDDEAYSEYTDDEELDLACLEEEDIDGEPFLAGDLEGLSIDPDVEMGSDGAGGGPEVKSVGGIQLSSATLAPTRRRPRAVDMFADSGSEDGK